MSKNSIEYLGGGKSNTPNKVRTEFGQIDAAKKEPSQPVVAGFINELIVPFNFDSLPTFNEDDAIIDILPAGSLILDARMYVIETFAGGVEYTVGLSEPDGTLIDIDALFTVADLPAAVLIAGNWIDGTGALINAPVPLDAQVIGDDGGNPFTAGKAKIMIRYILPF